MLWWLGPGDLNDIVAAPGDPCGPFNPGRVKCRLAWSREGSNRGAHNHN